MKEKKKKKGLARLMEIAGQRKGLLIVAGTLSALSSACMLVPYWAVYEVLRLLLTGNAASGEMVHWGWVAFGGLVEDHGDRSLICSPKIRIEKRKSVIAASVSVMSSVTICS